MELNLKNQYNYYYNNYSDEDGDCQGGSECYVVVTPCSQNPGSESWLSQVRSCVGLANRLNPQCLVFHIHDIRFVVVLLRRVV